MSPTSKAKKADTDTPRSRRETSNPRNLPEPEPPPSPPQKLPGAQRPGTQDDTVVDPTPFIDPDVEVPEDQREPIVG